MAAGNPGGVNPQLASFSPPGLPRVVVTVSVDGLNERRPTRNLETSRVPKFLFGG